MAYYLRDFLFLIDFNGQVEFMYFLIIASQKKTIEISKYGAFCQFSFPWIHYYGSNKSTRLEIGKSRREKKKEFKARNFFI